MESKRRSFLRNASILAGAAVLGNPLSAIAEVNKKINSLANGNAVSVYHTGNMNGQLGSNAEQLGGLREIKVLLDGQEAAGLVLDAGNFMGKIHRHEMISWMNKTGYHAATIGTAELKDGLSGLAALIPLMNFPLVNCNYQFSDPVLTSKVKPYAVIYSGNLKVGITGVGQETSVAGLHVNDPYLSLNNTVKTLKDQEQCDLVICLSNLNPEAKTYHNKGLAEQSTGVDLIIGKNGTQVMSGAFITRNALDQEVVLSQVGYDGLILGKTVFGFNSSKVYHNLQHEYLVAGLPLKNNHLQAHRILSQMAVGTVSVEA